MSTFGTSASLSPPFGVLVLDPITAKIAAGVTASLSGKAAKPIGAAALDAAIGKRETRAAEKAIRRAVDQGVEEVRADGASTHC
ncbi:hypothetical protein ABT075_46430 [Streptomyces sp. NPDC002677]|uniref:hypothetical protein n=1 Tax=Streptomyces sp. NPDC002677 TaxID=3154774 RepID=UPI003334367D